MNALPRIFDDTALSTRPVNGERSPDDLLTNEQLAAALQVSPRTPEGWRMRGEGPPFIRVGRRAIRYRWGTVLKHLQSRSVNSTSEEAA